MFVVLIIILFIAAYLYHHFTKYNKYWKERNVAGPAPAFFFGNVRELFFRRKFIGQIYTEICANYPNEKIVGIFRMRTPALLVKDPEIIKHILIKDSDIFLDRDQHFSHKRLGANLFHADADTWQLLRNRLSPIFTSGKLKNMLHLIVKSADKLMDYTDNIIREQREQVDVHKVLKKFTQQNIAACAFGFNLDSYDKHVQTLDDLERQIFRLDHRVELEMMYPGFLKKANWSLVPKRVSDFFYNLTKDIINQRNGEPTGQNDFVDLLLSLRKEKTIFGLGRKDQRTKSLEINDDIITSEIFLFYLSGYQTTATTMSYMLHHLAFNNNIQDKVVAEIETVLQNHGNEYSYEALTELKYMEQVMYETLRIQPIADSVRRVANASYNVPGTNLTVEKGQVFIIPSQVVNMDPKFHRNPERFDPDRFSPENLRQMHPCAFMSFGHGPRNCIGRRFGRVQIKVCMAKLLRRFRVEISQDTPDRFQYEASRLSVFPIGGFPLRLVHRN